MRSISTLPVAAARATKSKTSSARLQQARSSSPRAWTFQARHFRSNSPAAARQRRRHREHWHFRPHARMTKRAVPGESVWAWRT